MPMASNGGIFQTANDSSSDEDEEDDEDDDDDDESDEEDLALISGHALDDEEDMDSDESSVEDEQEEMPAPANKGKEQSVDSQNPLSVVFFQARNDRFQKRTIMPAKRSVSVPQSFPVGRARMHWIDF